MDEEIADTCGGRIKRLRRARKMSQGALGVAVGRSRVDVYRWESGMSQPTVESLRRLARALGVSMDYLAGESGRAPDTGDEAA